MPCPFSINWPGPERLLASVKVRPAAGVTVTVVAIVPAAISMPLPSIVALFKTTPEDRIVPP